MRITGALKPVSYETVVTGELGGETAATQMPDIECSMVMFSALQDNASTVFIGVSGVTADDGTTDTTTGFALEAKMQTPWIPIGNMNQLYYICNATGDDFTYLAVR